MNKTKASVMRMMRGWPRLNLERMCLMMALLVCGLGCSSELDPTEPDDAYTMFRDAMFRGDTDAVWGRLDPTSHAYFESSYAELVEMDATIDRYLPQADHRLARRQSGVVLLRDVDDGRELFDELFTPKQLPADDEAVELGSRVETVSVTEDQKFAKVITRAGQEFYLSRGEDEQWYVMLVKSSSELQKSMGWLEANKVALRQTVDDLIAEERTKREAIIAELINP